MQRTKRKSLLQEKRVAKELNGRTTPASGALDCAKGDVRSKYFLVECKTTSKDYYPLRRDIWDKISYEALKDGLRTPVMCIDLKDGKNRYAVVLADIFVTPHVADTFQECIKDLPSLNVLFNKSFRVREEMIVMWEYQGHIIRLLIIDWNTFLDLSKLYIEEMEE